MFDQLEGLVAPVLPRPADPLAARAVDLVLEKLNTAFSRVQRELHGGVNDPSSCDVADLIDVLGNWVPAKYDKETAGNGIVQWPEQLSYLFDAVFSYFRRKNKPDDVAVTEARDLVIVIAEYLGGRTLYLPGNDDLRAAVRDAQIYALQGRMPTSEIARRYGLTVQRISMICAEQRAVRVRKLQGVLFQTDDPTG